MDTNKLNLLANNKLRHVQRTSRKASAIAFASTADVTGGVPCIWAIAAVAIVTISPNPKMIGCLAVSIGYR